jgi:hypothetical protein
MPQTVSQPTTDNPRPPSRQPIVGADRFVHGFQVGPQAKWLMINFAGGVSAFYADMARELR